jgi:hypothetical protein
LSAQIKITNPKGEEFSSGAVLDTGAELNYISQVTALTWDLERTDSEPHAARTATGAYAIVYGAVKMTFSLTDAWGQSRTFEDIFWCIDRKDPWPIVGMPHMARNEYHLHPAANEFRFGIGARVDSITAAEDIAEELRSAFLYCVVTNVAYKFSVHAYLQHVSQ